MKKKRAQNSTRTAHTGFKKGNQHRFKAGRSGNPGRRPKKDLAAAIARMVFEKKRDAIEKFLEGLVLGG